MHKKDFIWHFSIQCNLQNASSWYITPHMICWNKATEASNCSYLRHCIRRPFILKHALLVFPLDINLKFTPRDFAMLKSVSRGRKQKVVLCTADWSMRQSTPNTNQSGLDQLCHSSSTHTCHTWENVSTCQCKVTSDYYQLFSPSYI